MIAEGRFRTQLNAVEKILIKVHLHEERARSPEKNLGVSFFRGKTYRQIYHDCLREFAYDFRLTDQSLLLFLKDGRDFHDGSLSFSYYESPVRVVTYKDFVASEFGLSPLDNDYESLVSEIGEELRSDYEQHVGSAELKNLITPIRYDYKPTQYREGFHPASHVHFGSGNEIRVGTNRIMNPVSFLLMILRQRYPQHWAVLLRSPHGHNWCRNVRELLDEVDAQYRNRLDSFELSLH